MKINPYKIEQLFFLVFLFNPSLLSFALDFNKNVTLKNPATIQSAYSVSSYLSGGSIPDPETRVLNTAYRVGAIPGTFNVSACGAATYSVPVFVPPGTNGMQPSLALNYNSNGGNDILGMGWSLAGSSVIYRTSSTYYHDGITDPVDFDNNDAFKMDAIRLIKDGLDYKTEIESYAVITPVYSGSSIIKFEVKTKDGKTIEYGNNNAKLQNSVTGKYFAWYISKVTDAFGNYVSYVYGNDTISGIRLVEIKYTGNAGAGLAPYNSVYFEYEECSSANIKYVYGQEVKHNLLLSRIRSTAGGNTSRVYDFNYVEDEDVSLLSEVIETGSDGTRFNSTIFNYYDYQVQNTQYISTHLKDRFSDKKYGDIDGDGQTDLVFVADSCINCYITNTGATGITSLGQLYIGSDDYEVGDFNGDGKDDIVVYFSSVVKFYQSTGSGFSYVPSSDISLSGIKKVHVADIDGDNIDDIIVERSSSLYVYKGDPDDPFNSGFSGTFDWGNESFFYDFTGDGKDELAIRDVFECHFYQFSNTGFASFYSETGSGLETVFGDFNGDGKMDFLRIRGSVKNDTSYVSAYIADGRSFFALDSSFTVTDKSYQFFSCDIDNDGKYEFYSMRSPYPFDPENIYSCQAYSYNGQSFEYKGIKIVSNTKESYLDFNGDGISDGIYTDANDSLLFDFDKQGNTKYRLHMVADGLNNKTIVTYDNITDNTVYSPNPSGTSSPYYSFNGPSYVVSQVQQSNGLGGYFTTNYSYTGGVRFRPLDEFMGFLQINATSSETQLTQLTDITFDTTSPVASKVVQTVTDNQGSNIRKVEMEYTIAAIANKRISNSLHYKNSWDYLDNTSTAGTYWTNSYGNITREQTVFSGGAGSVNTYYEDYATVGGSPVPNVPQTIRVVNVNGSKPAFEQKTTITYNSSNGFMTSKVIEPDKPKPLTTTYTPVSNGLGLVWKERVSGSDITTRETIYEWDSEGRFITRSRSPEGQLTEIITDPLSGNVVSTALPSGFTDESTYDGFGRLLYNKASNQTISRNWYSGSLPNCIYYIQTTGSGKPEQLVYYDRLGRELKTQVQAFETGKDIVVSKSYNNKGQAASVSAPFFNGDTSYNTVFTYDAYGRVTEKDYSNNTQKHTCAYSAKQVVVTNTSASPSQSVTKLFNDRGHLIKVKDTNNNELNYSYSSNGEIETISTPDGVVTAQFDVYGRTSQVSDPDMGTISYTYYATGEVKSKTQNGRTTSFTYNRNGQIRTITESEGTTTYNYNSTTGLLSSIDGINNNDAFFTYDEIGRLNSKTETVDGSNYIFGYEYADGYTSRLSKMAYPGNFAVAYSYNNGYLAEIRNYNGNGLIWQLQETTPLNHVEKYKNGNNLVTTNTYNYQTGMISRIQTGMLQDWQYSFDPGTGNLNWRKDNKHNLQEDFGYDNLNRLTSVTFGGNTLDISFNNSGNITSREGLGSYGYDAPQPHAVSEITPSGSYNPENQVATYTSFDKLSSITQGNKNLVLTYGYDHQRRKTVYTEGNATKTKIFIPGGYEKIIEGSATKEFYYIGTPAGVTSVYEKVNGSGAMYYIHPDYLGSVNFITNSGGGMVQELGFDAWGRQRNAGDWSYSSLPVPKFERGYTFHEQLDAFELVNMNGRMYDPVVGRFLSPDPAQQPPGNLQGYNRYSYALNNPLKYTDPSGYFSAPAEESSGRDADGNKWLIDDSFPMGGTGGWYNAYVEALFGGYNFGAANFMNSYYSGLYSPGYNGTISYYTTYFLTDKPKEVSNDGSQMIGEVTIISTKHTITIGTYSGEGAYSGGGASSQGGSNNPIEYFGAANDIALGTAMGYNALNNDIKRKYAYKLSKRTGAKSGKIYQSAKSFGKSSAKVLGKSANVIAVGSIAYDFGTGTANTATLVDAGLLIGGTAAVAIVGTVAAPFVVGAGAVYGVSCLFGFDDYLNETFDISGSINFINNE